MTDRYQVTVAGRLGPVLCSYFPGFSAAVHVESTILVGTCGSAADLDRVLEILNRHRMTAAEVHLKRPAGEP